MRNQTILISGGGITGLTLAHWLARRGFTPVIVERAAAPRPGGQAIDIRGAALEVVRRMGILDQARAARTQLRGMVMLDGQGRETWRSEERTYTGGVIENSDIELLREDLVGLLEPAVGEQVERLYGDSVTALEQDGNGVRVSFSHAAPRTFDLVAGADGLHSTVRELAFGPEGGFLHHLGSYVAIFGAGNFLDLRDWQVWVTEGTAGYGIYPVHGNTGMRVSFGFASGPLDYDFRDIGQQKQIVAGQLASLHWETPRLLAAMRQAPDFYFDAMAQVRMEHWSQGRVVLAGDAGYCSSPLSGQGTSLALVGAYVLAEELARAGGDQQAAFAGYEARMRPFAELNQALAVENPGGPPADESVERAKNAISLDR
jgi:2-polyprenyl-6-methoxyphenol hydroxylase-like FAD-dependent oxidoreductase